MILGIFVGGKARRMGGTPKGLLPAPDTGEALVVRLARIGAEAGLEPVLVGSAEPYAALVPTLRRLPDAPAGIGPLGGLMALLDASAPAQALAVACDMPFVSRELLVRVATAPLAADVLAPRTGDRWQPLCARYDAGALRGPVATAIASGVRSFQRLFDALTVATLTLTPDEQAQLVDWDTPEDVSRD
ncbi:MAG: molybdenum cofactor guanylyltransferase [Polyangiales bacterium]